MQQDWDKEKCLERIKLGEDNCTQFKQEIHSPKTLAEEMVAFSNADGGILFIGVEDNGSILGIKSADIGGLNQHISNASSQMVDPPIHPFTQNIAIGEKIIVLITVRKGLQKPYRTQGGRFLMKSGADKRLLSL